MQISAELSLAIGHRGQFAQSHAMPQGNVKASGEGVEIGIEQGAFDMSTSDWIGTVQYEKRKMISGGFFHTVQHCAGVRVKARADVLNVEDQGIDVAQHGRLDAM